MSKLKNETKGIKEWTGACTRHGGACLSQGPSNALRVSHLQARKLCVNKCSKGKKNRDKRMYSHDINHSARHMVWIWPTRSGGSVAQKRCKKMLRCNDGTPRWNNNRQNKINQWRRQKNPGVLDAIVLFLFFYVFSLVFFGLLFSVGEHTATRCPIRSWTLSKRRT